MCQGIGDHLCFDCKYNQLIEEEELDFGCVRNLTEDWNIGWYKNITSCEEFEQVDLESEVYDEVESIKEE